MSKMKYFVAECKDFHKGGLLYPQINNPVDAICLWDDIPEKRRNGGKTIGVMIPHPETEKIYYLVDIIYDKVIDLTILPYIPGFLENEEMVMELMTFIEMFLFMEDVKTSYKEKFDRKRKE